MRTMMSFIIGKCLQTSLFVTLLMVTVAWGMGHHLTLNFDGFDGVLIALSAFHATGADLENAQNYDTVSTTCEIASGLTDVLVQRPSTAAHLYVPSPRPIAPFQHKKTKQSIVDQLMYDEKVAVAPIRPLSNNHARSTISNIKDQEHH